MLYRDFKAKKANIKGFESFDRYYRLSLLALILICWWFPFNQWQFNRYLTDKATELAGGEPVSIHCDSAIDAIFEDGVGRAGSAYIEERRIVFHYSWCGKLKNFLDNPQEKLTREERFSMHVFTHEVMHIRGEYNEQKTDCQAIQRDYQAALLLGVPEYVARENALDYYQTEYPRHPYYSSQCHPGGPMDEKLPNSVWKFL